MFKRVFNKDKAFMMIAEITSFLSSLADGKYVIEIKKHHEKRSLSANAYYWVLLEKIAKELSKENPISKEELHNKMLQDYGTLLKVDNQVVSLSTETFIDDLKTDLHLKLRGQSELNGKTFYHYYLIKGSSEYSSDEFKALLDGAISEAKQLGIETLTPRELELLKYE